MLDVLKVSGPIYLLIIIGYGATHFNLFSKADLRVLGKFVINFALPALIFNALAKRAFSEVFDPIYFFAYLGGSLLVILLGFVLLPKTSKQHSNNPINRAIYALGMSCSNSGFVGYPILLLAIPAVAENTLALNVPQVTIMDKNVLCVHIIHDPCPNISIMSKARTNIEAPWVKRARIFIPQS